MVILRARVMSGGWAVPVLITTLPMINALTDGGAVDWSVQAVLMPWPAGDEGALSNLGRANHCHYYGRRLQRRPVHHRQVELLGLHVQHAPN